MDQETNLLIEPGNIRVSNISERIANLSPIRLELLSQQLKKKGGMNARLGTIPRRSATRGNFPLSFAQQRLWFLDQLEPGSAAYNIPASVRLSGALQLGALEQSLNEIIRRHESLRTSFGTFEGQPVQVIAAAEWVELAVIDLSGFGEEEREAAGLRLAQEEAQRPFDLARGPLLRVSLLRLAEQEHIALLTMHHIISDGWSVGVMIREVAALYEAYVGGGTSPLAELPIQYADYAVWQREWLSGSVLDEQLAYWKQQLGGELPVLELPLDRPRLGAQGSRGATKFFGFSQELSEGVLRLSQKEGVTIFTTLLAAFKVLLHYYGGRDEILVGTDVANRTHAETELLMGFFVNQLVLRTSLSGDPTFQELLKRVHEVGLGAYAHQDLPFDHLVEALNPERSLKYSPLFQVKLVLQNAPMPPLKLSHLALSQMHVERATAQFDLVLNMSSTNEGLTGLLEYNTDLFDARTIMRLLDHYERILAHILSRPQERLKDLEGILAEADRQHWARKGQELEDASRSRLGSIRRQAFRSTVS